ncbi:MAG TPA: vitamin K epoxide reductase family protein [Vicinamibacterales bacterium]|nr:vitamin K epoxide reductase family protein [Vicinamibacterales bacterium]
MIALSLAAAGSMGLIALYQSGLIRHIPEPPLPRLDADKVDASAEAFERLEVGDAFLGFVSYGVTMTLAAMGSPDRAMRQPWIPLALAGKVAFDVGMAAKLTVDQWTKHKAFCFWCLVAATATFAAAPLVVGETRRALATLATNRKHLTA